jgi:hypothetical protein
MSYFLNAFLSSSEHSLSSMCRAGAAPLVRNWEWSAVHALMISLAWRLGRGLVRMELESKLYITKLYWFPRDDLVGKRPVWSEYDFRWVFSVMVVMNKTFWVVGFIGSWAGEMSRDVASGSGVIGVLVDCRFFCCMRSMLHMGCPLRPLLSMFTTLQKMKHYIGTAFAISTDSLTGGDVPFQGLGQGNRSGPMAWAIVSAPIINMVRTAGYGDTLSWQYLVLLFVCYAFVDDTNLVHTGPSEEHSGLDFIPEIQER